MGIGGPEYDSDDRNDALFETGVLNEFKFDLANEEEVNGLEDPVI